MSEIRLNPCPACGRMVSSRATCCPGCGDPLTVPAPGPQAEVTPSGSVVLRDWMADASTPNEAAAGAPRASSRMGTVMKALVGCILAILVIAVTAPLFVRASGEAQGSVVPAIATAAPSVSETEMAPADAAEPAVEEPAATLGIPRGAVVSRFTAPDLGFTFETSAPVDGQPQVNGKSPDGLTNLELIGDEEDLASIALLVTLPSDRLELAVKNASSLAGLLKQFVGQEASDWFTSRLKLAGAQQDADATTEINGYQVSVSSVQAPGMICLSIKPGSGIRAPADEPVTVSPLPGLPASGTAVPAGKERVPGYPHLSLPVSVTLNEQDAERLAGDRWAELRRENAGTHPDGNGTTADGNSVPLAATGLSLTCSRPLPGETEATGNTYSLFVETLPQWNAAQKLLQAKGVTPVKVEHVYGYGVGD